MDLCISPRSSSSSGTPEHDWSVNAGIFESSSWDPTNKNSGQTVTGTIPSNPLKQLYPHTYPQLNPHTYYPIPNDGNGEKNPYTLAEFGLISSSEGNTICSASPPFSNIPSFLESPFPGFTPTSALPGFTPASVIPGRTPTSISSGFVPPSEGFSNQLRGKRAPLSDPPCSDDNPPTNGMHLPQSLEKGSRLHTSVLKKQKKLLDLHKDENCNSVKPSPLLIHKPHWSPGVPSSSPYYSSPRLPKISDSPFSQFSVSGSSSSVVESQTTPVEAAAKVKEPSLQFIVPNVEEAVPPLRLLSNIGPKNNKTNRQKKKKKKKEFRSTAASSLSVQTKDEGCLEHGTPTGLGESRLEQKEEDCITEANLASHLKLGEKDLHRVTLECDAAIKLCFRNKRPYVYEMEKLLKKLKDLNRDLKCQSKIYQEVIEKKSKAQQLSDARCIEWISTRNRTLRDAISFMMNTKKKYLLNGSNIDEAMALKILQVCCCLVFGEDAEMVQIFCSEPGNPIKMSNVERVVNDLEEVAGIKPWFTGFSVFVTP